MTHATLYFGAGGGADVLAALALARARESDRDWLVAGWLSPLHDHFFLNEQPGRDMVTPDDSYSYERVVNAAQPFLRFKRSWSGPRPWHDLGTWRAVASHRPCAIDELWRSIDAYRIRLLSTRRSVEEIARFIGSFRRVVLVDVGSDILFDGSQSGVRTPVLDAFALVSARASAVPEIELILIGLGLDGEVVGDDLQRTVLRYGLSVEPLSDLLITELLRVIRVLPIGHSGSSLRALCDRVAMDRQRTRDQRDEVVEKWALHLVRADVQRVLTANPLVAFRNVSPMYSWWEGRNGGSTT